MGTNLNDNSYDSLVEDEIKFWSKELIKSIRKGIYNIKHGEAVSIIQELNSYQQDTSSIPEGITGYKEWK